MLCKKDRGDFLEAVIKVMEICDFSCVPHCAAERRRSTPAPKEEEKVNEEQWPLREVVFVEDVKNVPVGKVGDPAGSRIRRLKLEVASDMMAVNNCKKKKQIKILN